MTTDSAHSFADDLKAEAAEIEADVSASEAEYEKLGARIASLRAQLDAVNVLLARHAVEPVKSERPEMQAEAVPSRPPGPSEIALQLAREAGGVVLASQLGKVLAESGRYSSRSSAQSSAYATLAQSKRFWKVDPGRFRLIVGSEGTPSEEN